jgi:alpha-D-xyloside xylohydrolase
MKYIKQTIILFLLFAIVSCGTYQKNSNSIIVKVASPEANGVKTIKVEVIDEQIVRIQSSSTSDIPMKESLMLDPDIPKKEVNWMVNKKDNLIVLSTPKIKVEINKDNGKIKFLDSENNLILTESQNVNATLQPYELDGDTYYELQQVFDSPDDEAFYGLGQHQNREVNYKGKDIDLLQHNIVAVVPFLLSNKNYGILWDNYSHSKFGDPREYQQLSILNLYDESGQKGGLSARYFSDREKVNLVKERIEDTVYYKYLDQQSSYPDGFPVDKGLVEWSGFIESNETGLYKLLVYSSGYLKVWINNELITESWRQCWNPWSRKFKVNMQMGKKLPIRIEWIPDGNESYISVECLTPYDEYLQNKLSLYSEAGKSIDYYFIKGENLDDVVSGYRQLTGKSQIMPNWAMGLWQSRERYKTQQELLDVVR